MVKLGENVLYLEVYHLQASTTPRSQEKLRNSGRVASQKLELPLQCFLLWLDNKLSNFASWITLFAGAGSKN